MMNWPGDEGLFEVVTTRFFLKKKHHYSTFLPNVSAIQPSKNLYHPWFVRTRTTALGSCPHEPP